MKSNILFSIIFLSLNFLSFEKATAQAPDWIWAKSIGGTSNDNANANVKAIALDNSGNVYSIGLFSGTVDFDPGVAIFNLTSSGTKDVFISKLDNFGNFIWAKTMGGINATCEAPSLILDSSGDIYSTGMFYGGTVDFNPGVGIFNLTSTGIADIFITKLNSSGNFVWAKAIGGTGYCGGWGSITLDGFGNVYTTGQFNGTADFDPGVGTFNLTVSGLNYSIFISKLDSSGNFIWAKAMGDANYYNYGRSIKLDVSGNVYTTGVFSGPGDFNPGIGIFNLNFTGGVGDANIFISKLNNSGNFIWAKAICGTLNASGNAIALDDSDNIYITGDFSGTVDFDAGSGIFNLTSAGGIYFTTYILKSDSSGNFLWLKSFDGINGNHGFSIDVDSFENVYTTGPCAGTTDFDPDSLATFNISVNGFYVSKLNSSGLFLWAKTVSGASSFSIVSDASGNEYIAGGFGSDSTTFGSTTLINADTFNPTSNIFIAKLGNSSVGIERIKNDNDISVFPNPAKENITIQFSPNAMIHQCILTDVLGRIIETQIINASIIQVDLHELLSGIYFIKLLGNESETLKLIKE